MVVLTEGWKSLVGKPGGNLKWAHEMEYSTLTTDIIDLYIQSGIPLVVSNCCKATDPNREEYSWEWLRTHMPDVPLVNSPRDNDNFADCIGWSVADYIDYLVQPPHLREPKNLYGKDMPCPDLWEQKMKDMFGKFQLQYHSPNDVMNDLPVALKPQTLQIYVGFGGNFTGAHIDICGTLGHNVMVYAEPGACAWWFVISNKDVKKAIKFWEEHGLGQYTLFTDNWFLSPHILAKANFDVCVIKQREGDFVFLPPSVPHQVINEGGRSVKIAWNRQTPETLERSISECLPMYRGRYKSEIYRLKATAYHALIKRVEIAKLCTEAKDFNVPLALALLREFQPLLRIVADLLWDESVDTESTAATTPCTLFTIGSAHTRVCNHCKCDIFNRCFHCPDCGRPDADGDTDFDACLECIAIGRGCKHVFEEPKMKLCEYIEQDEIQKNFDSAMLAYIALAKAVRTCDTHANFLASLAEPKPENRVSIATIACEKMNRKEKQIKCVTCNGETDEVLKCYDCRKRSCKNCLMKKDKLSYATIMSYLRERQWICTSCRTNPNPLRHSAWKLEKSKKRKAPKVDVNVLPKIPRRSADTPPSLKPGSQNISPSFSFMSQPTPPRSSAASRLTETQSLFSQTLNSKPTPHDHSPNKKPKAQFKPKPTNPNNSRNSANSKSTEESQTTSQPTANNSENIKPYAALPQIEYPTPPPAADPTKAQCSDPAKSSYAALPQIEYYPTTTTPPTPTNPKTAPKSTPKPNPNPLPTHSPSPKPPTGTHNLNTKNTPPQYPNSRPSTQANAYPTHPAYLPTSTPQPVPNQYSNPIPVYSPPFKPPAYGHSRKFAPPHPSTQPYNSPYATPPPPYHQPAPHHYSNPIPVYSPPPYQPSAYRHNPNFTPPLRYQQMYNQYNPHPPAYG